MTTDHLEIRTPTYISQVDRLADNLFSLKRVHHYKPGFETVDTFGNFNLVAFATLKEGSVTISHGPQSFSPSGSLALFIPKYSVVKWTVNTSVLEWSSYISNHTITDKLNTITVLDCNESDFKTIEDLNTCITNSQIKFAFDHPSQNSLPKQIKDYLDEHQYDAVEIGQLCEKFNLTASQVTKIFKKYYGITPVEYRSKVRVFNSMFSLLISGRNTDVTQIAYESGFSDLSRFNKQFKKITRTTPSKFKFKASEK
jgi:AraC-like DNA-binding protein